MTSKGDVVLFSEATVHGCLPWTSESSRRVALFRFSPSTSAFARGYLNWSPNFLQLMTPAQTAVM